MQTQNSTERDQAVERIRDAVSQTNTIYGTVRHVSKSGMRRHIHFFTIKDNEIYHLDYAITQALPRLKMTKSGPGALIVDGCGMDMIFSVVYAVSSVLYPDAPYTISHRQI